MTPRQSQCLAFVTAFIAERGFAPSFTDIMHGLSLKSKSGIYRLLSSLESHGYIERVKTKARGIKLSTSKSEWQPIETAPRKGERILLTDGLEVHEGSFDYVDPEDEFYDGSFDLDEEIWVWYDGHQDHLMVDHPTHWMPLPAPPGEGKSL